MKLSVRGTFSKRDLRLPVMKVFWSSTVWFRNVDCANWRNSYIDDRTTVYLQKMIEDYDFSQLNLISLKLDMKFYGVDKGL